MKQNTVEKYLAQKYYLLGMIPSEGLSDICPIGYLVPWLVKHKDYC